MVSKMWRIFVISANFVISVIFVILWILWLCNWVKIQKLPLFIGSIFKIHPFSLGRNSPHFIGSKFKNYPYLLGQYSKVTPFLGQNSKITPFLGQIQNSPPFLGQNSKSPSLLSQNSKTPFYWFNICKHKIETKILGIWKSRDFTPFPGIVRLG